MARLYRDIPKKVLYEGDGYTDGNIVYDMARCLERVIGIRKHHLQTGGDNRGKMQKVQNRHERQNRQGVAG